MIRAGMLKLGGGMLEELLAADPGYRGPQVPCSQGHQAEFVAYRDKTSTPCSARGLAGTIGRFARSDVTDSYRNFQSGLRPKTGGRLRVLGVWDFTFWRVCARFSKSGDTGWRHPEPWTQARSCCHTLRVIHHGTPSRPLSQLQF